MIMDYNCKVPSAQTPAGCAYWPTASLVPSVGLPVSSDVERPSSHMSF